MINTGNFLKRHFSNRKKVLVLSIIFVLICLGIAGTYFYDSDISSGNEVKMSFFDLKVNGIDNQGAIIKVPFAIAGNSYTTTVPVKLTGSGSGKLYLKFLNVQNSQGGQTEPEIEAEKAAGKEIYDLNEQIYVSINGGTRSTLKEGLSKTVGEIQSEVTTDVVITFDIKTTSVDNVYQGDVCAFDIAFCCDQTKP